MMYLNNTQTLHVLPKKQTNFTNTLIQDIPIFKGNDSTWLEDWLVDIETAVDLSAESGTKHAQAKSKGLTHTLILQKLLPQVSVGMILRIYSI